MKNLAMIACVSRDGGLGMQGELLWRIPEDQKFFRATTMGSPIVMGGTTFASIGRALPGRENIVLSRRGGDDLAVKWFNDQAKLDEYLDKIAGKKFIIGGASIYRLYLPLAEELILTEVDAVKPADVFFPKFDRNDYRAEVLQTGTYDGVNYQMVKYTRKAN